MFFPGCGGWSVVTVRDSNGPVSLQVGRAGAAGGVKSPDTVTYRDVKPGRSGPDFPLVLLASNSLPCGILPD